MRIKVFKAPTLREAMALVKDEFGSDAVILKKKNVSKGGFLGYNKKEYVEVTAAIDEEAKIGSRANHAKKLQAAAEAALPKSVLAQYKTAGTESGLAMAREKSVGSRTRKTSPSRPTTGSTARTRKSHLQEDNVSPYGSSEFAPLENSFKPAEPEQAKSRVIKAAHVPEMNIQTQNSSLSMPQMPAAGMPQMTAANMQQMAQPQNVQQPAPSPEQAEKINQLETELAQMKEILQEVMSKENRSSDTLSLQDALKQQEVEDMVIQDMIAHMSAGEILAAKNMPLAVSALSRYLQSAVKFSEGISLEKTGSPKIVALIGTTGVGKTTTLAKIAARLVLEQGINVALITADTYRISAVEQLKTYSDIIGLPLEIVYSPAELKAAIHKHRNKQLILIDTAGRSQHNDYQMQELQSFLEVDPDIERHLVLSSTTKNRDAYDILEKFSVCEPKYVVFTKTDETNSVGLILNLLYKKKITLSYLTNGQSVPDDIVPAQPEKLAELLLR